MVQQAWDFVLRGGVLAADMCEAYVAAAAFFLWIVLFKLAALLTPLRRFGDESRSGARRTWSDFFRIASSNDVACVMSLPAYLFAIGTFHTYFPKNRSAQLVEEMRIAPPAHRLLAEVAIGVVLYDFVFFWIHLAMHKNRTLFRLVHARHHAHRWLSPGSTVVHSLVDGFLQVAVNILVQQISPWGIGSKHLASKLLHNVVVTFMLVEAHSEFDCAFSLHNLAPSIFGGALRHRYHHARGRGSRQVFFQQFFRYLDDYFGFVVSDKACRSVVFDRRTAMGAAIESPIIQSSSKMHRDSL